MISIQAIIIQLKIHLSDFEQLALFPFSISPYNYLSGLERHVTSKEHQLDSTFASTCNLLEGALRWPLET